MCQKSAAGDCTEALGGNAAPRPPAGRDHLQCGYQRLREGPTATALRAPQDLSIYCRSCSLDALLPDVISYNAAISACEKGPRPQKARYLLPVFLWGGPSSCAVASSRVLNQMVHSEREMQFLGSGPMRSLLTRLSLTARGTSRRSRHGSWCRILSHAV